MKLIHTTALVLLLVLVQACNMLKTAKLMKSGSVRQSVFKTEVPFEMRLGLIILKVNIHGKNYDFLFDTGAPNVISKELAQEQGITPNASRKAGDSQGNSGSLGFTAIDSVGISGLQFLNTGAAIADLRKSPEIGCLNIDGLVGANLMRKAIWQVDFERQIITISNDRSAFIIPPEAKIIKFRTTLSGTPLMDIRMNGQTDHNVEVDLGSNGHFDSSEETYMLLMKNGLRTRTYSYGYGSAGLYGKGKEDTTWHAVISTIQIDSLKLSNQAVSFHKKGAKLVGTGFFKHYRLILDWSSGQLIMIPVSPYDNISQKTFRFSFVMKDQQVFIGSVYSGAGEAEGPQLGDQVLEIDGKDYRNCNAGNYCSLLGLRFNTQASTMSLLVKRGDKELTFKVAKETLIQL